MPDSKSNPRPLRVTRFTVGHSSDQPDGQSPTGTPDAGMLPGAVRHLLALGRLRLLVPSILSPGPSPAGTYGSWTASWIRPTSNLLVREAASLRRVLPCWPAARRRASPPCCRLRVSRSRTGCRRVFGRRCPDTSTGPTPPKPPCWARVVPITDERPDNPSDDFVARTAS